MNIAAKAREAAMAIECKKDAVRQVQCGDWRLTLTIAAADMPVRVITAPPGVRYMLAIVEIGDDEQPVSPSAPSGESAAGAPLLPPAEATQAPSQAEGGKAPPRRAWHTLTAPQQAGIRCSDELFQTWLWGESPDYGEYHGETWVPDTKPTDADEWEEWTIKRVRRMCGIISRAALATDPEARARWQALDTAYMQATGQIAENPRG